MDIKEYINKVTEAVGRPNVGSIKMTIGIGIHGDKVLVVEDSPTTITFTINKQEASSDYDEKLFKQMLDEGKL